MKTYDFDKVIDRRNTNSSKFDFMVENGKPEDALPLWVADMDFKVADPIIEAIRKACDHGIFGYSQEKEDYYKAVSGWFSRRFGWTPEKEWLVTTPGVVFAFSIAVQAYTEPGEAVILQPPVYYPFFNAINTNGRKLVESPLVLNDGHYEMDLTDFENKIIENQVKLFLMCSPHNPVGRVWTKEELKQIAAICKKHGVIILVDEIHCDFVWEGHEHTMFLDACPDCKDITISCTAPSKTFNLAGLQASNIWIPNKELRRKFRDNLAKVGFFSLNNMGIIACQTAYSQGEEWFDQCKEYIYQNYLFMKEFIAENIPQLKVMELEGTYLAWVDFSALGLSPDEVDHLITNKAKLWLDEGRIFGQGGENFQRFVLACPRATLKEALERLAAAIMN
ncbi:MAG: pyridoxal phosphate-dependent aminotransferase [Firmicutes bacterium]|nr:pyridoxal phosphate-dependent aminotransferase [Bacillota bacterium]